MATKKRTPKLITDPKILDIVFKTPVSEYNTSFFMELFGDFGDGPLVQPYDEIYMEPGTYGKEGKKNKKRQLTTVGIFIFNRFAIEEELFDLFKYINHELNKKQLGKLTETMKYALLEDDITTSQLGNFLMKIQKIMPYVAVLSPNISMDILNLASTLEPKKQKLLKENKEAIEKGDPVVVSNIEKELIKEAKDILKDDPALDVYDSGAKSSYTNDFKNMYIMNGCIKDPDPKAKLPYKVATSSWMNGVSREEYVTLCSSLVAGPYARANKTQYGGYWEKLTISGYQHIKAGPKDSDCGTKDTVDVYLTEKNIGIWMYSYIKDGSSLVELTSKNKDKYLGKKVKFRFSSLCEYSKDPTCICNKCLGNLFYRVGITNVGASMPAIPARLKNISMKSFHNSQVTTHKLDLMKVFSLE